MKRTDKDRLFALVILAVFSIWLTPLIEAMASWIEAKASVVKAEAAAKRSQAWDQSGLSSDLTFCAGDDLISSSTSDLQLVPDAGTGDMLNGLAIKPGIGSGSTVQTLIDRKSLARVLNTKPASQSISQRL